MRRESTRGGRGWFSAILVAICLLLIFYFGAQYASKPRVSYRDPRTTVLTVTTTPKNPVSIATQNLPLAIEPLDQVLETQSWTAYRSDYTHSIGMIEPPAGVRLMAPVSTIIEEPFTSPSYGTYGRDPLQLANDASHQLQINASMVSTTRSNKTPVVLRDPPPTDPAISPSGGKAWPQSPKLRELLGETFQIADQERHEISRVVANRISGLLESLVQHELSDPTSRGRIEALQAAGAECVQIASQLNADQGELATALARLAYAIERRAVVWLTIHDCVVRGDQLVSLRQHHVNSQAVLQRIDTLEKGLRRTGDVENWKNYLLLGQLKGIALKGITGSEEQVALAREFLSRVLNAGTSEAQRGILTSPEVHLLADLMHPLTIGPVDYVRVLSDIETLEAEPTHRCSQSLAEAVQSLRFSEHPEQAAISQAIAAHYRNANVRIAVSETFVNRMLPKQTHTQKPVRQTILGADTRGASEIETELRVDFRPELNGWKVGLLLKGDIASNTRSSRNGATFYNTSLANVQSAREIHVQPSGFQVDGQPATVSSNESLRKFSTDWDSLPILGDVIRNIAHQEFIEKRPIAKRIMHSTIAKETDREFDAQLNAKLTATQVQLQNRLIGPLQNLELHPMIMDMQSTETRLIVRYRVASETQLGAHTARPIAPADSILSMQVHQSALNNIASQIATADRDWSAQELADHIADLLQQERFVVNDEQAAGVRVKFHTNNPVTVEFDQGKLWLTLRIDALEQPGRINLKNFVIRTSYTPEVDGLQAILVRDGVVSVDGTRLTSISSRDRITLRAIFTKILAAQNGVPMVAESLLQDERALGFAVSQLEMRDGWMAIAISEATSPHVAALQVSGKR